MKRFKRLFRGRGENERGATFILTALSLVLLLWAGATGVDVGFSVYGSRQAQAMADTAAIDLSRYISYADTLNGIPAVNTYFSTKLAQVLADNGSNAQLTVIPGYYANGKFTKDGYSGSSCAPVKLPYPGTPGCNAIEVTANQIVPQIFFGGTNLLPGHSGSIVSGSVSGSSIASYSPQAAFSIGSYLLSLNTQQSAVLNKILGPMDSNISLTAVGFEGLATTNVTLAQLISANSSVLTPSNIMTTQLTAAQWGTVYLNAIATAYGVSSTQYTNFQTQLGSSLSNSSTTDIPLCDMVNVNTAASTFNCTNHSISAQGLDASVNVLQMLTTEAELSDGTSAINITSALNLPNQLLGGFGNSSISFQAIQPVQTAYGPVGTTAETAQVQATVNVNLQTLLGISIGTLSISLTAASGTATLQALTCVDNAMTSTDVGASTNAVTAGVTLSGLNVATLSVNGVSGATVPFTASEVPPNSTSISNETNPAYIGTTTPTLSFSSIAGLGLTNSFVNSLLSSTSVLSEAIGPVLQALGIQVAGAQITDLGTNCDAVQLVQ